MTCEFSLKTFDELTSVDLYHILKARSQVFVVEQNCAYQDIDEVDFDCLHLVAHKNEKLIGYCRIIAPKFNTVKSKPYNSANASGVMPAIGRVLVLPEYRGSGLARQIMTQAIKYCRKQYGKKPIAISAQTYLIRFYESLGFVPNSEFYLEDGLEHVDMILHLRKKVKATSPRSGSAKILTNLLIVLVLLFIAGLAYLTL
ncbi:GNAT family N-acetyltransferase [Psychrobacter frigidicola]|uniref:GNAT family N-acetyltransferase n=1 Tax=Psychrobacter frigidicola TaxID=45611 RepID=A0A5C7A2K5_9GAMM|nr:GNAT family N-acetyltransferase [Psychrobacter frigidicola]TXD97797.1 GNAT family N-acetyltransferase [Psychrobacter frigidicola]